MADAAAVPEDLDSSVLGPYAVPDTGRRRMAGLVYLVAAVIVAVAIVPLRLPTAMWVTTVGLLVVIGGYHSVSGWHLRIRESGALEAANRTAGFAVGHSSASLGFTGWRARPVWNVLLFAADEPPSRRALVRIDAISGAVVESYVEAIPQA
ncbi:MAG: hypothetical protein EHM57_04220 [Actinobacteria bacterium]|nr:MAG: hypothetical protein EHM57_04220 [Actinomycetota bacterium]